MGGPGRCGGGQVTTWEVERDDIGWSIIVYRNDSRDLVRSRWTGMNCIDAQVIAAELNTAHRLGRIEAIEAMRAQVLGD